MSRILERLLSAEDLSRTDAAGVLRDMAAGHMDPAHSGAILAALRLKGETAEELAGFADAMRLLAKNPNLPTDPRPLLDIVGTGGDGSFSFNLSTGSALLAAACGLRIAKHGNRAISSQCGSADVLEALGLPMPLGEAAAAACLDRTGFTFLFAPHYHPAMAAVGPVRRALGVRTIFNMLGPLTNPAQPRFGVIGAFSPQAARTMAGALAALPIERYFVIHGAEGWDEPTPMGPFLRLDVRPGRVGESTIDPTEFGVTRCRPESLRGGDAAFNAAALRSALTDSAAALQDSLVLGAALALQVAGLAPSPAEAAKAARTAIHEGAAARTLSAIRAFGDAVRTQGAAHA